MKSGNKSGKRSTGEDKSKIKAENTAVNYCCVFCWFWGKEIEQIKD
ncbi:hypothetical protein CBFG_01510 [Clostridiales bacterium 1_7_47FAA]|nr:hypothetical protein CBFG_01510 [Clostridiales bacterium 1_7_47FAA]